MYVCIRKDSANFQKHINFKGPSDFLKIKTLPCTRKNSPIFWNSLCKIIPDQHKRVAFRKLQKVLNHSTLSCTVVCTTYTRIYCTQTWCIVNLGITTPHFLLPPNTAVQTHSVIHTAPVPIHPTIVLPPCTHLQKVVLSLLTSASLPFFVCTLSASRQRQRDNVRQRNRASGTWKNSKNAKVSAGLCV